MKKLIIAQVLFFSVNSFATIPASVDVDQLTETLLNIYERAENIKISHKPNEVLPPYYDSTFLALDLKVELLKQKIPNAYKYSNQILKIFTEEITIKTVEVDTDITHYVTRHHTVKEYKELAKKILVSDP
jgi:hypothetical protein